MRHNNPEIQTAFSKGGEKQLNCKPWTEQELQILKENYATTPKPRLQQLLPSRSWSAIYIRGHQHLKINRECVSLLSILGNRPLLVMKEAEKAWIAAGLDFEGTIGIAKLTEPKKTRHRPYIGIVNTDIRLLEEVKRILGLGIIDKTAAKSTPESRWKQAYLARTHDMGRIFSILELVRPYLISKREQADCVMEFIEIQDKRHEQLRIGMATEYTRRQMELIEEIHRLNRRGKEVMDR